MPCGNVASLLKHLAARVTTSKKPLLRVSSRMNVKSGNTHLEWWTASRRVRGRPRRERQSSLSASIHIASHLPLHDKTLIAWSIVAGPCLTAGATSSVLHSPSTAVWQTTKDAVQSALRDRRMDANPNSIPTPGIQHVPKTWGQETISVVENPPCRQASSCQRLHQRHCRHRRACTAEPGMR